MVESKVQQPRLAMLGVKLTANGSGKPQQKYSDQNKGQQQIQMNQSWVIEEDDSVELIETSPNTIKTAQYTNIRIYKEMQTTWQLTDLGNQNRPLIPDIQIKKSVDGLSDADLEYGEQVESSFQFKEILCEHNNPSVISSTYHGNLYFTNFKILFKPSSNEPLNQHISLYFSIPYGFIYSVVEKQTTKSGSKPEFFVEVLSKDMRKLKFFLKDLVEAIYLRDSIKRLAFYDANNSNISEFFNLTFARKYFTALIDSGQKNQNKITDATKILALNAKAWSNYQDPLEEFYRQGIKLQNDLTSQVRGQFKVYNNSNYELCGTYPSVLIFPSNASDEVIRGSAQLRSANRLPTLAYYDKHYRTSIWRCAQPLEVSSWFVKTNFDHELLRLIGQCNDRRENKEGILRIYDARPKVNAQANMLRGGGYEGCGPGSNNPNCILKFCNIENIHAVRDAYEAMLSIAQTSSVKDTNSSKSYAWMQQIDSTGYRQVLQFILDSVNEMLENLTNPPYQNVLVHCSDGWDRTSQMSSLAQLLLDPYYRTFQGFQCLIEKDWLSFGHMFARRSGHCSMTDTSNRSPIFLQFLDCVHQIWHQQPNQFEFNSELLLFIAHHIHSCKYGSFFFNCEQERKLHRTNEKTISIWMEINLRKNTDFKNPYYTTPDTLLRLTIIPTTAFYKLRVWREYFFRFSDSVHDSSYKLDYNEQLDVRIAQTQELNLLLTQLKERVIKQSELLITQGLETEKQNQLLKWQQLNLETSPLFKMTMEFDDSESSTTNRRTLLTRK